MISTKPHIDLSVILSVDKQPGRLAALLPEIRTALAPLSIAFQIIVPLGDPDESTCLLIEQHQAMLATPKRNGYGAAFLAGLCEATGDYVLAVDADQEYPADLINALWHSRDIAEVIVASRYVQGGLAIVPPIRKLFSRLLNIVFSRGLDLHLNDMSSGFRMYKAHAIKNLQLESQDYDILQEILVKSLMEGYQIREIPFKYHSSDTQLPRVFWFGLAYLKTFARLWLLRNSISSADYDARAYNALMPPQRYWQRQRYKHITQMSAGEGRCLDVGCGSSRIIGSLPPDSVALDISMRKLRFDRRYTLPGVQGSVVNLPVASRSFPCVICSQVIEHVTRTNVLSELDRVLEPGGYLILGTPDYAKWQWIVIEWLYGLLLPQAYADEHITHYTYRELFDEFVSRRGYELEAVHYILQGELILGLRKPPAQDG